MEVVVGDGSAKLGCVALQVVEHGFGNDDASRLEDYGVADGVVCVGVVEFQLEVVGKHTAANVE